MAKKNDTRFFENKLLDFVAAKDSLLEMLQWMMDKFMEIEVARKTGAPKGSHSQTRTGYRCGYRVRRFDTRLGTVYLSVPKIRQGGYIPFFVTEKKHSEQFPKAVECLEEGFEDSVQFYAFEELDGRKISSTNTLERLNREIRRRSSVVGIFPSTDSYIRLITSYLLEYSDDWQTERCYMNAGSIKLQKKILFDAA